MGFWGKTFYFYYLFSQGPTLPVYLFVSWFVNLHFLPYYFSALNIFQGFSLNFARTSGRAVDKLLNGSRVNSHRQFIFGKQGSSLFRCNTAFQQNRRCYFSHFLDMVKTRLWFTFLFVKVNRLSWKCELNIPFGPNEIYAIWTVHFKGREFFNNYYFVS